MPLGYKITLVACGVLVFGVLFYMVDQMGGDGKTGTGAGAGGGGLIADGTGTGGTPNSSGNPGNPGNAAATTGTGATPGTPATPPAIGVGSGATTGNSGNPVTPGNPGGAVTPGTGTTNSGATTGPNTGTSTPVNPVTPGTPGTAISGSGTATSPNATTGNRVVDELLNDRVRLQHISRTHTVGKGETLSSISEKYFGKDKYWIAIAKMNPAINPNRLRLGQTIQMPDPDLIAAAEANGGRLNLEAIKPVAGPVPGPTQTVNGGTPANPGANVGAGANSGTQPNGPKVGGPGVTPNPTANGGVGTSPKVAVGGAGRKAVQVKPTTPAAPPRKWVRVEEGETLLSIAEREYSNRKYWRTIYDANRARLRGNPNIVPEGMSLAIP